jgi:hypothetical protein
MIIPFSSVFLDDDKAGEAVAIPSLNLSGCRLLINRARAATKAAKGP